MPKPMLRAVPWLSPRVVRAYVAIRDTRPDRKSRLGHQRCPHPIAGGEYYLLLVRLGSAPRRGAWRTASGTEDAFALCADCAVRRGLATWVLAPPIATGEAPE